MIIKVRVHPKSKKVKVVRGPTWEIWVNSPPEKNHANEEALSLISKELGVSKSKIGLVRGSKSRIKHFRVDI